MGRITTRVRPTGSMALLSQLEIEFLKRRENSRSYSLFRKCSLAVLAAGHTASDDPTQMLETYADFDINIINQDRGVLLELVNAPEQAFVDGELIAGIKENLSAVIRDIIYHEVLHSEFMVAPGNESARISHNIHAMLRNAGTLRQGEDPNLVVCWGGHSISRPEYEYAKEVGYELGLRGANICTGCGPGIMYAPMKGAAIGHAKQHLGPQLHLGLTEPGIIASEAPNPMVNNLVILPDIEKRLEAFIRMGHGIIVFPGAVGTAQEIFCLLGVLMHPDNTEQQLPVIFTASKEQADYFHQIDRFIRHTLGEAATSKYQIIIDDPAKVAQTMKQALQQVRQYRKTVNDAFHFNWSLRFDWEFQHPFEPTHEAMAALEIHRDLPPRTLASNLCKLFSGLVAGNVRSDYKAIIAQQGKFRLQGDPGIMQHLDQLLEAFVEQGRMKLPGTGKYEPCYELVA